MIGCGYVIEVTSVTSHTGFIKHSIILFSLTQGSERLGDREGVWWALEVSAGGTPIFI